MAKNYYDITLAMAGISQAARLVQQLAHEGQMDGEAFHTSLNSLLQMDPPSTLAVFGGEERNLKMGLETLIGVLNANNKGPAAVSTSHVGEFPDRPKANSCTGGNHDEVKVGGPALSNHWSVL